MIYGVVDGEIVKMQIRPDQYGAFFTHFVTDHAVAPRTPDTPETPATATNQ